MLAEIISLVALFHICAYFYHKEKTEGKKGNITFYISLVLSVIAVMNFDYRLNGGGANVVNDRIAVSDFIAFWTLFFTCAAAYQYGVLDGYGKRYFYITLPISIALSFLMFVAK